MAKTCKKPEVVNISGSYFYKDFLSKVEKELQAKAYKVRIGYEAFSKADQLAFLILEKLGYFSVENESTNSSFNSKVTEDWQ